MAFCSGGTLEQRLQRNQIRTQEGQLVEIQKTEPLEKVELWLSELSNAAAWLEELGFCHTDLRLANLLLGDQDHLKVTDFDCMETIGSPALGSAPPWGRVLGPEAGSDCGTFGYNGARVEQFAIGSVLYSMTRGHEPYDSPEDSSGMLDGPDVVDLLQQMKFPSLGAGRLDNLIDRCWKGDYPLLKVLADETKLLLGANSLPRATPLTAEYCRKAREECEQLIKLGLLDWVEENFPN